MITFRPTLLLWIALCLASLSMPARLGAHCQIPCGIYDDQLRISLLAEHISTIEKSIAEISRLQKEKKKNDNQLIRWVDNKEVHAQKIQDIVSDYFLAQRVKPITKNKPESYKNYTTQLALLHQLSYFAMKAKQTADKQYVEELRDLLAQFRRAYFAKSEKMDKH